MDETGPASTGFARQFADMKRRGCTVLVVSDAGCGPAICRGLLGSGGLTRRHVLVPTTASVADLLSRRTGTDRDPHRLGVVDASGAARNGVATASAGPAAIDRSAGWYSRVERLPDLACFVREIDAHLSRLAPADPEPGELRLCLDSLDPFVDAVGTPELFRFVHVLAGLVRDSRGLGHVHVAPGTVPAVADVRPLFDATVEVRAEGDGSPRQRWTVHETGDETAWLDLEDPITH